MTLRPRHAVLGVEPYVPGKSSVAGANRVMKLSSNEGAFGPPPGAIAAIAAAAADAHRYPDGGANALRAAIGRAHGLDPSRIVCGAGSDDIIYQLCAAYGGEGAELLMSAHGFSIYAIAGRLAGCAIRTAPERDLTADVDALLAAVTARTRLVFLANPNNPTGTMVSGPEIWRLREGLPPDVLLVLDAAYAEYVQRDDYEAGAALVDVRENTVMTRTFSKIYGLGGLRVGWCYAPASVVDVLDRVRAPFNVSLVGQAAAAAAVADRAFVERARAHNAAARARLTGALRALGLRVWDSEANFVLAGFGSPARATSADAALQACGIIVRAVGGYGLPECLRITVGTDAETAAVIEALEDFLR